MQEIKQTRNVPEYSVSEISGAVKRLVEETFGHLRLRGEISGYRGPHASGHCYFALKDEKSKIEAVIWKGTIGRLRFKPEEGMEVIATGKISTFPGSSKYQMVIEQMEPAGVGALMALLEERKKKLAAEGLFDPKRKKPIPMVPEVIGIVTSPTGAVIRDMLHRLADRFPRHVLLWPVAVQGEGAAEQIAGAIRGFNSRQSSVVSRQYAKDTSLSENRTDNRQPTTDDFLTPDIIIVARGGGSIEDLWAFNEEIVARAVAESRIPIISAVGHETDTTLIDYVADLRAPTPTAAAEMAVPVLADLLYTLRDHQQRLDVSQRQRMQQLSVHLEGLARGLPRPADLLGQAAQRLDPWGERLQGSLNLALQKRSQRLEILAHSLPKPTELITQAKERLSLWQERLQGAVLRGVSVRKERLQAVGRGLQPARLQHALAQPHKDLQRLGVELGRIALLFQQKEKDLQAMARQLDLLDYKNVLKRGYALVRNEAGKLITNVSAAAQASALTLTFQDGEFAPNTPPAEKPKRAVARKKEEQESLF